MSSLHEKRVVVMDKSISPQKAAEGPQKIALVEILADGGLEDLKRWAQWFFRVPFGCRKRGLALIGCGRFQLDAANQRAQTRSRARPPDLRNVVTV